MKKRIFAIIMGTLLILSGCSAKQTDLVKLQGDWKNDSGDIIIYAPNEKDDISGDADIIDGGTTKNAAYELHESSQKIIFTYSDSWGDQVNVTYKYEFINDIELNLTPVEYSDSTTTYSIEDQDTLVFEKVE